jgi:glycyl-tRNA synthetase beta chain
LNYKGTSAEKRFKAMESCVDEVRSFLKERLQHYLLENNFKYDIVNAILAGRGNYDRVTDAIARAEAVTKIRDSDGFEAISIAFKRISKILKQAKEKGLRVPDGFTNTFKATEADIQLRQAIESILGEYKQLDLTHNYDAALASMSRLRQPIDSFFEKVMVLTEDKELREYRLSLLNTLQHQFTTIADFSEIVTESKAA